MKKVLALALFALAFVMPAPAQMNSRTIDFSAQLLAVNGKPLQPGDPKTTEPLTLGAIAVEALVGQLDQDKNATGTEKFKRFQLAQKIYGHATVELTLEEVKIIKDRIGFAYGPAVVGPAWSMLESNPVEKK